MTQSAPVFTSVSYDGQYLRAQWVATPPASGFTGYTVTLTENSNPGEVFNVSTTTFTLNRVLTPASTYTLQVAMLVTGQPPMPSGVVTLITQAPRFTSLANSGTQVVYRWVAAGGAGISGYVAGLDTPTTNWSNSTNATTLTTTFVHALTGLGMCTGWVRATGSSGVVMGPATPVRIIITEAPALTSIANSGAQVVYRWTAAGGSGVEGYFAGLNSPATNWSNSTNAATLTTTFVHALAGAGTCTGWVRGASSDGIVLGPPTPTRIVITEAPVLTSIANSGAQVVYRWTAAGGSGVEGYFAGLNSPATNWSNSTNAVTLTTTFLHALAGAGTCTGWVRGTSADGMVLGPSTPMRTLVTEAPMITLLDNNGTSVVYTWQAAGGAGLEAYFAGLNTPATNWNNITDAATLTTTFAHALVNAGTCTGWVRGTSSDGIVLGPPTPILTLITQPPVLNGLDYTIGVLGVTWVPTHEGTVANYVATVTTAGQPATDYSLGLSGTGTALVTLTLGGTYNVVVRGSAPQLKGPPSNLLQPITTCPVASSLTATMPSGFKVTWSADGNPQVTGYVAEFFANGSSQGTVPEIASPAPFPGSIATGVLYQGRVRSTAPNLKGPWSNSVNGPYQSRQIPTLDALGRLTGASWDSHVSAVYQVDVFGNVQSATWTTSGP